MTRGNFMHWIAPSEKNADNAALEKRLWDASTRLVCHARTKKVIFGFNLFNSALNEKGRAGFVMANPAADTRSFKLELRKQFIEARSVGVMDFLSSL